MYYTYSIKNLENGKFYIGSRTAKCMLNRKPEDDLGVKYFSSSKDKELRQAIKDGNVKYTVLQEYDDAKVCWRAEQQLIAIYWKFFGKDMSYNHSCVNCNGEVIFSTSSTSPSEETRKKMSAAKKGLHLSEETRKKLSVARKGSHPSEETRKKLSAVLKGSHHTEETKVKISEANKGKHYLSEESRKKLSEANKGKHYLSEESRKKLSEANKGKHHSDEAKTKISEFQKGRPKSTEHRKKISESLKGKPQKKFYWQTNEGEIKEMDKANAMRYHKDWILLNE